jgi:hypothetical protein
MSLTAAGASKFLSRLGDRTPRWPRAAEGEKRLSGAPQAVSAKKSLEKTYSKQRRYAGKLSANLAKSVKFFAENRAKRMYASAT